MAGLYFHIPFCRQKCHYCNFYSLATRKYRNEIFEGLIKELEIQRNYLGREKLDTIYFGGGTPSLYEPEIIDKLIKKAIEICGVNDNPEITLEANPDDITPRWLEKLSKTLVNRLSIGVQSFRDDDLKYLNRVHSAKDAVNAVELVKKFGFNNLSIDLIYGIPTLTEEAWKLNLQTVSQLEAPHISAYALTVEPGTALDQFIKKGKYKATDDGDAHKHFDIIVEQLIRRGYEHYEISNFALPGKYARHNTSYWTGEKYLGLGPSAHSFDQQSRQWNVSNIKAYLEGIDAGKLNFDEEVLTKNQKINEYIMTSLRTMWGMDLQKIEKGFGNDYMIEIKTRTAKHLQSGQLEFVGQKLFITERGKFFADGIASDLFFEED